MFEAHRAKKAQHAYQEALADWTEQHDQYAALLKLVQEFNGETSTEIMLGNGETLFYNISGVGLIEERKGVGHYQGHSSGFSVPIGSVGGHAVRYRVGANRGHYVQGAPTLAAIDTGSMYVTNQRVIFAGAKQTRECTFKKLIGFQHDDAEGSTTFSVSNRRKPTTLHYGPKLSGQFDFRLDLALAHYRGSVADLISQVTQEIAGIDTHRPTIPAGTPG